jgi:hypothetical protein
MYPNLSLSERKEIGEKKPYMIIDDEDLITV